MSAAAESERPPASKGAHDDGAWPADTDDSPWATAKRARRALEIARELRDDFKELRASIDSLSASVGTLTGAIGSTRSLISWALRLVGGAAAKIWIWLSTLHH